MKSKMEFKSNGNIRPLFIRLNHFRSSHWLKYKAHGGSGEEKPSCVCEREIFMSRKATMVKANGT